MLSSHPRRPLLLALAGIAALFASLLAVPPAAHAGGPVAELTALVNQERAAAGLPALETSPELADVAARHSERMAASADLHHNPNLGSEVSNWQRITENVGRGPDVRTVHEALMASASHAANILDAHVSQIGIGIVSDGGSVWVTQVFRQPTEASAPPPPPPPTSEPEPPPAPPPPPEEEEDEPPAPPESEPPPPQPEPTADHEDATTPSAVSPTPPERDPGPAPAVTVAPAVAGVVPSLSPDTTTHLLAAIRLVAVLWVLVD